MTDFWDEYEFPNGVSADVAGSLTFDGKIYGVPYSIIYNTIIITKISSISMVLKSPRLLMSS